MNKIKKSTTVILGILLTGLFGAIAPASAQVTDVNVVNTPTVILPRGSTVGIDSSNNTVKIDPNAPVKVLGEKTEVVHNQIITPFCCQPFFSAKVDVSEYKQIRIVARREPGNNSTVWITPFLCIENGQNYWGCMAPFDDEVFENKLNRVYDTPGSFVQVMIQGGGSVRILIYGRRN